MARSRYSRRRSAIRRRRFSRRIRRRTYRSRRSRYGRPDQGYIEKIVTTTPFFASTVAGRGTTFQYYNAAWFPMTPAAAPNAQEGIAPNRNTQWTQVVGMWDKYQPIGMKLRYIPPTTLDSSLCSVAIGTKMEPGTLVNLG